MPGNKRIREMSHEESFEYFKNRTILPCRIGNKESFWGEGIDMIN